MYYMLYLSGGKVQSACFFLRILTELRISLNWSYHNLVLTVPIRLSQCIHLGDELSVLYFLQELGSQKTPAACL